MVIKKREGNKPNETFKLIVTKNSKGKCPKCSSTKIQYDYIEKNNRKIFKQVYCQKCKKQSEEFYVATYKHSQYIND